MGFSRTNPLPVPAFKETTVKILLPVLILTLALSACGGTPSPSPDTPGTPGPLTQIFHATGRVVNYTPSSDAPLSITAGSASLAVGMLKAGGAVDVHITAAQAQALPSNRFSASFDGWKASGCDVSNLTVQDTAYHALGRIGFTAPGGAASVLKPETFVTDAGVTTRTVNILYFSLGSGALRGRVKCQDSDITLQTDVTLKPGWNIVKETFVTDASDKLLSVVWGGAVQTSTYDGAWYAFRTQP